MKIMSVTATEIPAQHPFSSPTITYLTFQSKNQSTKNIWSPPRKQVSNPRQASICFHHHRYGDPSTTPLFLPNHHTPHLTFQSKNQSTKNIWSPPRKQVSNPRQASICFHHHRYGDPSTTPLFLPNHHISHLTFQSKHQSTKNIWSPPRKQVSNPRQASICFHHYRYSYPCTTPLLFPHPSHTHLTFQNKNQGTKNIWSPPRKQVSNPRQASLPLLSSPLRKTSQHTPNRSVVKVSLFSSFCSSIK